MTRPDPWRELRQWTEARVALGSAGPSLPTREALGFQLAHAEARDAVHLPLDAATLTAELAQNAIPSVGVRSRAADRATYLQRPDLGRRLAIDAALPPSKECDLAIIVADGLSARAVHENAVPLVTRLRIDLIAEDWTIAPVVIAHQGRVALGDEIGERLGATLALVLLGERPGLSAPDSLGAYLTHHPRVGRSDAERNCVSNIRDGGLSAGAAAFKIGWLLRESRRRALSGVALKDASDTLALPG